MDLGFMQRARLDRAARFAAASQGEAAHLLLQAVRTGDPVVVVTGAAGLGKTTVLDAALAGIEPDAWRLLRVRAPFPTPLALQHRFAALLELPDPHAASPADLAQALLLLPGTAQAVASVTVVVDGVEDLPSPLLQYLWLMYSLTCFERPALQLVLVGRDSFWRRLGEAELAGLRRSVSARLAIQPLSDGEAAGLLQHLLSERRRTAEPLAEAELLRLAGGIPGRLTTLLDAACAGLSPRQGVRVADVRTALGTPVEDAGVPDPVRAPRRPKAAALREWAAARPLRLGMAGITLVLAVAAWQLLSAGPRPAMRVAATATPPLPQLQRPVVDQILPTPPAAPTPAVPTTSSAIRAVPRAAPLVVAPQLQWAALDPASIVDRARLLLKLSSDTGAALAEAVSRADATLAALVPVPVSPAAAMVVLADSTAAHVQVLYPSGDARAEARARLAVATLRADHVDVSDPRAVDYSATRSGIGYFFNIDRDSAGDIAGKLASLVEPGEVRVLPMRSVPPPPGTVEVLVAGR